MSLSRIRLLRSSRASLTPLSYPHLHQKRASSLPVGDSKPANPKSLSSIFANPSPDPQSKKPSCRNHANPKKGKMEDGMRPPSRASSTFWSLQVKRFPEELSSEASLLLKYLHEEGYLKLEPGQIPANSLSRQLLKSVAEKVGLDHQEIAKWLSGSDLKRVALFGCPSVDRKTVFASKRLRSFFCIQEDVICRGCKLKTSCRFVNQRVDKVDSVILPDVMRLLTLLAFDAVPHQIAVPKDLKFSVDKLLKEAVNLSR